MDLGLKGKWALVGGASKGLGFGCANSLAREGVNVVIVARGAEALEAAAQQLLSQKSPAFDQEGARWRMARKDGHLAPQQQLAAAAAAAAAAAPA